MFRTLLLADTYRLTTRTHGREADEITMRQRSLLEMMGFLSHGVDVPDEHLALEIAQSRAEELQELVPLRVRSQAERPDDAFVATRFRGYWFFIPSSDRRSKQAFGLLARLFQMQAPLIRGAAPLVTVPTGRGWCQVPITNHSSLPRVQRLA